MSVYSAGFSLRLGGDAGAEAPLYAVCDTGRSATPRFDHAEGSKRRLSTENGTALVSRPNVPYSAISCAA